MLAHRAPVYALAGALLTALVAPSQGEFVNYEPPQIKPVAIATVDHGDRERDWVLICNTPDNSVEIYRAEAPFDFVARVPVGLSPVTVRWFPDQGRFYTCNFVGDSVTTVRLEPAAGLPPTVRPVVERATFVGDEPADIAFVNEGQQALVTLNSQSAVTLRNGADLALIAPEIPITWDFGPGVKFAVKQPRTMAVLPDGRFYCLNFMGSNSVLDFDVFVSNPVNPPPGQSTEFQRLGGLGTTNFNFAVTGGGDKMFVVGLDGRNFDGIGVNAVGQLQTGFAQSWLWVVDLLPGNPGDPPLRAPEAIAGGPLPAPTLRSINLNRDYTQAPLTQVAPGAARAHPTDVVVIEDGQGNLEQLVVTLFGSSKLAVLSPDATVHGGWRIRQRAVPLADPGAAYGAAGPRSLAYSDSAADPATPRRPGLCYVVNRLDNSWLVFNPRTMAILHHRPLRNDPTPDPIRRGRPFLYSTEFSGSKMVACASCHLDARTDALPWNLGDLKTGAPIAVHLHDGDGFTQQTMPNFPNDKGFMITQTLQGLVNHLVNRDLQLLFTNAPYHWRGDKRGIEEFNEAFVNLQGMSDLDPEPDSEAGLTAQQMSDYRGFIDTIRHPPNPEQPKDRRYHGDQGDPNDPLTGSGAQLGMKLFHTVPLIVGRGCVHCHSLPDGSSNTLTLTALINGGLNPSGAQAHPMETAATRNLFQREMVLASGFDATPANDVTFTQNFGLLHNGSLGAPNPVNWSINDFVVRVFRNLLPGSPAEQLTGARAITELMRTFDTGTAPMIGLTYTFDPANPNLNQALSTLMQRQVEEANIGIAVYTRNNGAERGFYYDLLANPPAYRLEGGSITVDWRGLHDLAQGADNVVILQAVPVGSERRVASLSGVPTQLTGPTPAGVRLVPMAPDTAFVGVSNLTANWDPNHPTHPFQWFGQGPEPISLKAIRALQSHLTGQFGVPGLRHEPPRRFRVIGENLRPGAQLGLAMATQSPGAFPARALWMDLHPTNYFFEGMRVWETTAEADSMVTMAMLSGGLWAPGVVETLQDLPLSQPLDAQTWNRYAVAVLNEDGTINLPPQWQRLRIQDVR